MTQHRDLWYTIGGRVVSVSELLPDQAHASTPLHVIESIQGGELFCNPWGNGSAIALEKTLAHVVERNSGPAEPRISLERAVEIILELQAHLESEIAQGVESALVRTLIDLKGYPLAEIQDGLHALGLMIAQLHGKRPLLNAMLDTDDADQFFLTHSVLPRFALIASGNLGLFETVLLLWAGVLAQAAQNGRQFSLIVKPSIYDFLFHELVALLPEDVSPAFSRITWRSEEGILPDSTLTARLVNAVDGAVYFGSRRTLMAFREMLTGRYESHRLYYDHFPIMLVLPGAEPDCFQAAASLAVMLAYKSRGEACLSLQSVFVHDVVYDGFVAAVTREWRRVCAAAGNPRQPGTLLAAYSRPHLEQIARLRERLDGAVMGRVYPEEYRTDLLVNHEIDADNWVLSTENAAPLLCVAPFGRAESLITSLRGQLALSSSDKFIYALMISGEDSQAEAILCDDLSRMSHRLEILCSTQAIRSFQAYVPGIPHCGGISFLADMFGLPHRQACYLKM